jgi:hypothetical protein
MTKIKEILINKLFLISLSEHKYSSILILIKQCNTSITYILLILLAERKKKKDELNKED